MRLIVIAALLYTPLLVANAHLDNGIALQRAGKLAEADRELRAAITELSVSGDRRDLLRAVGVESWVSVSLGDYADAIRQATQAVQLRRGLHDEKHIANDLNTLAVANQYSGNYDTALEYFAQALRADREAGDAEGEITRLNNIGTVFFLEGRYLDALRRYEQAKSEIDAARSEPWIPRRRQLTLANLATLYQQLGMEQTAIGFYRDLAGSAAMPARERGQFLLNQGALYRRLGDPVKALELYRAAEDLYAVDHFSDGKIGALRNVGIARALDLDDLKGALDAFDAALRLANSSSNQRAIVQSRLYRGETLRRLRRWNEAAADALSALQGAKSAGLVEEHWRALYLLGRIAESTGDRETAGERYVAAIALIESLRTALSNVALRSEFLADKRDVYDALISLRVNDGAPVEEVFRLVESSRSRALNERVSLASMQDLRTLQSRLSANSVLLDYWIGPESRATVWITSSRAGVVRYADGIQESATKLIELLQSGGDHWHDVSRILGSALLSQVPIVPHLIVVPDGPLTGIPFEALTTPGSDTLVIEQSDVSYLPSAQFLSRQRVPGIPRLPWSRQMVAFGDPPVPTSDTLAGGWQRLSASLAEIRAIQKILPGRSEAHVDTDAQKKYITGGALQNVPILHFSTHAMIDRENPDRSRILLASNYLFQREVFDLDLKGVNLVTVSACDSGRGKTVRGEGVQAFSRAFLAAGAASTVTSLWRVADEPAATFMKQFYYYLARGRSKSEALRSAKLELLHSRSALVHPRYWAAFVLTGDGSTPVPLAVPLGIALLAAAGALAVIALIAYWAVRAARPVRQTEQPLTETSLQ